MAMECSLILKERFTLAVGIMIRLKDTVLTSKRINPSMKGHGFRTCSMEKESNNGQMALTLKESTRQERKTVLGNTNGPMVLVMKVSGRTMR